MNSPIGQTVAPGLCTILQREIPHRRSLTSREFVRGFSPPDYLLDGILQRGFCYSLTAATGAGKTAITLRLLACAALGRTFAGLGVQPGPALMLCGENPDDVTMRWIAMSEQMGFDVDTIPADFIRGVFSIRDALPQICASAGTIGGVSLVIVDTAPAYFEGDDENSNRELGDHARMIRKLTQLPGNPCVLANCHPAKNAQPDNLLPRGGGAFVAEIDGNLVLAKADQVVELHWQGKFRGPDFEPLPFELITATSELLKDLRGRLVPTVIAKPLSESEHAAKADATDRDLKQLVRTMAGNPGASVATLATAAGWTNMAGVPNKAKVFRLLNALRKQRLRCKRTQFLDAHPSRSEGGKEGGISVKNPLKRWVRPSGVSRTSETVRNGQPRITQIPQKPCRFSETICQKGETFRLLFWSFRFTPFPRRKTETRGRTRGMSGRRRAPQPKRISTQCRSREFSLSHPLTVACIQPANRPRPLGAQHASKISRLGRRADH